MNAEPIAASNSTEQVIVNGITAFLSPSPVNYTFDDIADKITEMTRLEISFGASFSKTKQTTIILNGLAVTFKPKQIQIIGDLAADEPLGGEAQARTTLAQRSMMQRLIQRNETSDSKRQLFLGAQFEFEGLGSDSRKWCSL